MKSAEQALAEQIDADGECGATLLDSRCVLPTGHDGDHMDQLGVGSIVWPRDPVAEGPA